MNLRGAFTALVTPFKNGEIDEERYREFIEWQITEGIDGLVPCGTTGESATLTHEEHERAISICIEQANKRVPVIAGAGSNNTAEAIRLTRFAKRVGADAALHITPYYNKPTQDGLYAHFKAIASSVDLPLIVYNVPGRTGCNVQAATMARMFKEIPTVVGAKDATGEFVQISETLELCGPDFILLSGDDFTVLPTLALGGRGVISVTSNIVPDKMAKLCAAWDAGDTATARAIHYELNCLNRACFVETNPIPVKTALAKMGKMSGELRLPMVPLKPQSDRCVTEALTALHLL
ncbi:4-hydroxy-tetrahydrodipicolinate synthase [Desulfovibrio sp. OttesenSCG-928-I05]|nr:4-hydroxy-tetrahydrodipicolinate synthase [Desulfovibrio sp. OttesenSCG-928-I05]